MENVLIQGTLAAVVIGLLVFAGLAPLFWTVLRVLRPIDLAAKARNAPFRFSIGDFLCLFWVVQVPLAFVFQLETEETVDFYWVFTGAVWLVAPVVWLTCARALSKAGVSQGIHRFIFLAVVVPTVYYGLFPLIGIQCAGILGLCMNGWQIVWQYRTAAMWWFVLSVALVACGFYSPWIVRNVAREESDREDELAGLEEPRHTSPLSSAVAESEAG